jgi:hypothetical protein
VSDTDHRPYLRIAGSLLCLMLVFTPPYLVAGGPKYIAGTSFFDPAVVGQPVHWAGGQLNYFVDLGPLNATATNQQATAMVDAAAALWSGVQTAGVALVNKGSLNEDVNGTNIVAANKTIVAPSDAGPTATNYPLAVIFDADGAVLDAILGADMSDPGNCQNNSVTVWIDNIKPDATIAHAVMVLNGRCATNANLLAMMSYELERAFGRLLGLDYSQVNPGALQDRDADSREGWPVMQPMSGVCGPAGGVCIPNPGTLRLDDIAALNRIYPITRSNLACFPGKVLTAENTVSIRGTITFRAGVGMQGVNVVARPLDASGNPLYKYSVTSVSGTYFSGNHGNAVTGWTDSNGMLLSQWGSNDAEMQGYFDLRFMPLPPGMTTANYMVTFEAVDPGYIYDNSVGPYLAGSPQPSGSLEPISVPGLSGGMSKTLTVNVADSAAGGYQDAISTEAAPRMLPPSGLWCGRLSQVGQADWFNFPVRGNRTFTVITEALDENGRPSTYKAMPALGIWDAFAAVGSAAVGAAPGLNGNAVGESWLRVTTSADDVVRLGIADMRGDGRPDYAYNGWVLYADTVEPQRLPASGGPIIIRGMGFHVADTVLVNGRPAQVTSVSPNEITAIAPAAGAGVTGSVDVEVDDLPVYYAASIVTGGVSYDAGAGDALTMVTAPANTVPIGVPTPFSVIALGPDLKRAGGVTVTFTVGSGTATLGCGKSTCTVTTNGDGNATMNVTAVDSTASVVVALLTNGSNVQAHFSGGNPPVLAALTPTLSLAAGATVSWTTQALVLNNGVPVGGQAVAWQTGSGIAALSNTATLTSSSGIAAKTIIVGPLTEGQQATSTACLNGTTQCVPFTVFGARPEYAYLEAVGGTTQTMAASATPQQITLRLRDMNGNPMAGGTVTLYQALYAWAPPCPPHGRCAAAQLLASQTSTAISGLDGSVTFVPASLPGIATNVVGLAASGNTSTLTLAIEQHP